MPVELAAHGDASVLEDEADLDDALNIAHPAAAERDRAEAVGVLLDDLPVARALREDRTDLVIGHHGSSDEERHGKQRQLRITRIGRMGEDRIGFQTQKFSYPSSSVSSV
jgi:hypothetical protein